jgi:hypothetical protein
MTQICSNFQKGHAMPASRAPMNVKKCVFSGVLLFAALSPCIAVAALGEPETSVQSDMVQMHASIKVTERAGYRVHEILLPSGTRVREFVGADGKVFAVAWDGPTVPDLRQTLGAYFDHYLAAAKAKVSGHQHLQIHQKDLVVEAGGHMRAFSGLAYLPPAVPSGVSVGDLH